MKQLLKILTYVVITLLSNTAIWADNNKLVPYQNPKTGRYGYKSADNIQIKDKFLLAYDFCGDRAVVVVSKKRILLYGIIGLDGKYVVNPTNRQLYTNNSFDLNDSCYND